MILQISVDSKCKIYKNNIELALLESDSTYNILLEEGNTVIKVVSYKHPIISLSREYYASRDNLEVFYLDSFNLRRLENVLHISIAFLLIFMLAIFLYLHLGSKLTKAFGIGEYPEVSLKQKEIFNSIDSIQVRSLEDTVERVLVDSNQTIIPDDFVFVPRGFFTKLEFDERLDKEYYVKVYVDSFYICKSELTQGEFARVMGNIDENNYKFEINTEYPTKYKTFQGKRLPVLGTYLDFAAYCNKRSLDEGYQGFYNIQGTSVSFNPKGNGYRLLYEDEWILAALGGKDKAAYKYIGGNNLSDVAWYGGNSGNKPHQVCTKNPNSIGLYDMAGNVWELLQSTYKGKYHYIAGNDYLQWPYSGWEFNEKAINYQYDNSFHAGTRIALIPKFQTNGVTK